MFRIEVGADPRAGQVSSTRPVCGAAWVAELPVKAPSSRTSAIFSIGRCRWQKGKPEWHDTGPRSWGDDVSRFHNALAAFDGYLASDQPLGAPTENLLQGPIADALTHVGQIAMMRRLAGVPIKGENYFVSEITVGRVGADQAAPRRQFD
jgi:hypothetical protein